MTIEEKTFEKASFVKKMLLDTWINFRDKMVLLYRFTGIFINILISFYFFITTYADGHFLFKSGLGWIQNMIG